MTHKAPHVTQADMDTCRTFGHMWDITSDYANVWAPNRVWHHRYCLLCARCTMRRFDCVDAYGDVGARFYDPPEGYSYAKKETPSRAELRLRLIAPTQERRQPQPA